jgi:hypothetical protein
LKSAGYDRSAFLKYIEEALAEGYAQLGVNGLLRRYRHIDFHSREATSQFLSWWPKARPSAA